MEHMEIEILNYTDMFFIKRYALGFSIDQIINELSIKNNSSFFERKREIKRKLGIVNDLNIIDKAYNIGLFVVDNYFLKNTNHIAFGVAYNLYLDREYNQISENNLSDLYSETLKILEEIIEKNEMKNKFLTKENQIKSNMLLSAC